MMDTFKIALNPNKGPVSSEFAKYQCSDLQSAFDFIRYLPYGRNSDKSNLLTIFKDQKGTCSTKHAVLKLLLDEQEFIRFQLILGIFRMDEAYHSGVGEILKQYKLPYIPEAHNYLKFQDEILDFTNSDSTPDKFRNKLIFEVPITPTQITDYKVAKHKQMIQHWLDTEQWIPYNSDEIWDIRELCIRKLSE